MPDYPYNERIFSPTTAERGWKYFLEGAVSVTGRRGQRYHAEVAGSYDYLVWLELDDKQQLLKGGCDCPVDGPCKHIAALWFALQAGGARHAEDKAEDKLADLLKQKSAEDLRALLLRLAENRETQERLTVLLQPEKGRDIYAVQIKKLFKTSRDGYDYYDAIDLGLAAQEWLQGVALDGDAALEQALPLVMPRLISALERFDDSEGKIASALDYAIELLRQVLAQPPYPQKLLEFLDKCLKKPAYFDFGDFGWDLYLLRARIWQEQEAFAAWEKWLDAKLKSSDNEWEQQSCMEYKLDMLQARGQSEAAQQFLAANLHLTSFRKKALAAAQAEQNWPRMEALLLEGIALAKQKGHYGTLFEWKEILLTVWQHMGKPIGELARELAFDRRFNPEYYHLWKQSIPTQEWAAEWEKLLASLAKQHPEEYLRPLLLEEKQFDLLLENLREAKFWAGLEYYLSRFPPQYSDDLLDIYLPLLAQWIQHGNKRSDHKENGKRIQNLYQLFPHHQARIQAFTDNLKARYSQKPRRPALLEEWTALGL